MKNEEFRTVYNNGKSHANEYLIMYTLQNGSEHNRFGVSASKKVGNSVVRHRMARLLRECFRLCGEDLRKGYDIVVVVRPSAAQFGYFQMRDAYMNLCRRHRLLSGESER